MMIVFEISYFSNVKHRLQYVFPYSDNEIIIIYLKICAARSLENNKVTRVMIRISILSIQYRPIITHCFINRT